MKDLLVMDVREKIGRYKYTLAENIETEETVEEANEQEAEDTETSEESEDTKKKFFKKKSLINLVK